jgi:predicted transcriptional regulator
MKKNEKDERTKTISLPQPSPSELRGRQSVRATFRLSGRAIEALSIVSYHLGIKQKSLFDHLLEDMEALNLIAERFNSEEFSQPNRMQKTYVLSRRTLRSLDRVAKSFDAPRDALVEYSIQRLLPVIAKEREKHGLRQAVFSDMTQYLNEGEKVLSKARELLGEEDPVYNRLETALTALLNAHNDIRSFVEKGKVIETF